MGAAIANPDPRKDWGGQCQRADSHSPPILRQCPIPHPFPMSWSGWPPPTTSATSPAPAPATRPRDGGHVRRGVFYRSNELQLTDVDAGTLADLGITRIHDLRGQMEIEAHPDVAVPGADLAARRGLRHPDGDGVRPRGRRRGRARDGRGVRRLRPRAARHARRTPRCSPTSRPSRSRSCSTAPPARTAPAGRPRCCSRSPASTATRSWPTTCSPTTSRRRPARSTSR